jgi:hypothetical protein
MNEELRIEKLICEKEMAKILGVSQSSLKNLRKMGCPWISLAGKVFYHEAKFMQWVLKTSLKVTDS